MPKKDYVNGTNGNAAPAEKKGFPFFTDDRGREERRVMKEDINKLFERVDSFEEWQKKANERFGALEKGAEGMNAKLDRILEHCSGGSAPVPAPKQPAPTPAPTPVPVTPEPSAPASPAGHNGLFVGTAYKWWDADNLCWGIPLQRLFDAKAAGHGIYEPIPYWVDAKGQPVQAPTTAEIARYWPH